MTAPALAGATLALIRGAQVPPPYVLAGESSAALDARVFVGLYPSEVAGQVLVNWADPALFLDLRSNNGKRGQRIPQWIYHSQDAEARAAASLGGRPLRVLSAGNIAAPPEVLEAWTKAQNDLARLSTRGR
ncbi:MAG: hypothetical protein P4L56_08700 [Candidatus Sulfopaludibacter sp.]|nr:hypothetical protein [Candidatus Sulfopaludibacter sp.]